MPGYAATISRSAICSGSRASVSTLPAPVWAAITWPTWRVVIRSPIGPDDLGQPDQQFLAQPCHAETGAVQGVSRRPAMLHAGAHLGLVGVAQPQLDPGIGHVQQGLLLADQPAAGAGGDVHAVGQALAGDRDGAIAHPVVLVVEVAEVVDDQEDVAELVVGIGATAAGRARTGAHGIPPMSI